MSTPLLGAGLTPEELWGRAIRAAKLLLLIAVIVLLDGFNRHSSLIDSFRQLPAVLYDFSVKYQEPLVRWYRTTPQGAHSERVDIPFEKIYGKEHPLSSGYFNLKDVPLLDAYLDEQLPALGFRSRSFFGYETTFPIYSLLVLFAPTWLLLVIGWNLARLRRRWLADAPPSSRLLEALPVIRASGRGRLIGTLKAALVAAVLLLGAILPPLALLGQQHMLRPAIKGVLHVQPLELPAVQDSFVLLVVRLTDFLAWSHVLLSLFDIGIAVFILSILLRKKTGTVQS